MFNHHSLIPWGSFRGRQEEKWGSFRGRSGDHFRVGDHFGVGISSGAVQIFKFNYEICTLEAVFQLSNAHGKGCLPSKSSSYCVIVWVRVVLKRTVVGD